jgi:CRISPR/Cas system-associated exonuclease Cas4 (RecB family)
VDERNSKVFIIDFKSSEVKDRVDAQKRTNKSFQLSVYALAWLKMFGELPHRVTLYFIEKNIIGESKRTMADLEKAWEKIVQIAEGIRNEKFPALPNKIKCSYCAYYEICYNIYRQK